MDTCTATWNGPFIGQLVTGGQIVTLHPGDQAEVTAADLDSGHWTAVEQTALPPAPAPTFSPPAADPPAERLTEGTD